MAFEIQINGSITPTFYELNGIGEITGSRLEDLQNKLMSGDYVISLSEGKVHSLPNFQLEALFKFDTNDDMLKVMGL